LANIGIIPQTYDSGMQEVPVVGPNAWQKDGYAVWADFPVENIYFAVGQETVQGRYADMLGELNNFISASSGNIPEAWSNTKRFAGFPYGTGNSAANCGYPAQERQEQTLFMQILNQSGFAAEAAKLHPTKIGNNSEATGWCNKESPSNACGSCSGESDCGGTGSTSYCWSAKDAKCSSPAPAPTPAGGAACNVSAPSNACGACASEEDCGNSDPSKVFCWGSRDAKCPSGPTPPPSPTHTTTPHSGPAPAPGAVVKAGLFYKSQQCNRDYQIPTDVTYSDIFLFYGSDFSSSATSYTVNSNVMSYKNAAKTPSDVKIYPTLGDGDSGFTKSEIDSLLATVNDGSNAVFTNGSGDIDGVVLELEQINTSGGWSSDDDVVKAMGNLADAMHSNNLKLWITVGSGGGAVSGLGCTLPSINGKCASIRACASTDQCIGNLMSFLGNVAKLANIGIIPQTYDSGMQEVPVAGPNAWQKDGYAVWADFPVENIYFAVGQETVQGRYADMLGELNNFISASSGNIPAAWSSTKRFAGFPYGTGNSAANCGYP
jgi:hypothetical protein